MSTGFYSVARLKFHTQNHVTCLYNSSFYKGLNLISNFFKLRFEGAVTLFDRRQLAFTVLQAY